MTQRRLSVVRANVAWCRCRPMQWWAGQSFKHDFTAQCYAGARLLVRRLRSKGMSEWMHLI